MSGVGGDISQLLRTLGREALLDECERAGLRRGLRVQCPWSGCEHKGKEREADAVPFAGAAGHFRIYCHACGETGDLLDLLQRLHGLSKEEAIARVRGQPVPDRPRPELRVVRTSAPEDPDKMEPSEVKRLWESLAIADAACTSYLEGRRLAGVVESGLVRFVPENAQDKRLSSRARQGYRIAALTSDVVGQPRGIQLRLARPAHNKDELKIVSVKGSVTGRAFFGQPGLIEASPVVAVAEGLPDTLAVQLWVDERVPVVGAAGKGVLRHLAGELEAAGIDITGKLFLLFPQNDRPQNKSRAQFNLLRTALLGRGARVAWVYTPDHQADVAAWWQEKSGTLAWPPPEVQQALGKEPGDETEPLTVLPKGVAVPIPSHFETKSLAQDFTTLCALLDDASYRETIFNSRGELTFNEMTTEVRWGERDLVSADYSTIRLGLERIPASKDGKPLKFEVPDIAQALGLVARRKTVHPVREWLQTLKWDGTPRLEGHLPTLLGHDEGSFEGRLLRRWLVSAVARAMEPGCKADNVLILLGKQRAKKSTFFSVLGGEWFTDSDVKPGDKDGQLKTRKKWIIEWGELDDIKSSKSMEAVKKFLSQRTDFFRSPYGKDTIERDRHCVFAGTSNEEEIFSDPTGNFRFLAIQLKLSGPRIDAAWLEDNREQLFAEALALYEGGKTCPECKAARERCSEHRWWLTDAEDAELGRRNKRFEIIDPWQSSVLQYLDANPSVDVVRIEWILGSDHLKHSADQLDVGALRRVGKVLRHLNWAPDKQRTEHGGWENVWRKPEVQP
jgi:hypothetical protein